eukprot:CAMPEP_0119328662 /NCGR_PEP_ID=MMETSP1333-20130426/73931_1 /TAXON_ID=418940 /ORGANISM="Scyphosphaera apsteinii, Strain RCC1455" /LENGTH=226 /DNA_ID=CAMNT_0007337585 /DNA_START=227 /DNA_END=908 /DNA_ORIENTATION=-
MPLLKEARTGARKFGACSPPTVRPLLHGAQTIWNVHLQKAQKVLSNRARARIRPAVHKPRSLRKENLFGGGRLWLAVSSYSLVAQRLAVDKRPNALPENHLHAKERHSRASLFQATAARAHCCGANNTPDIEALDGASRFDARKFLDPHPIGSCVASELAAMKRLKPDDALIQFLLERSFTFRAPRTLNLDRLVSFQDVHHSQHALLALDETPLATNHKTAEQTLN